MRIAQVAPLAEAVPPQLYGGTERVVSWLTEELVETTYVVSPSFGSSLMHCQWDPLLHGLGPLVDHWSSAPSAFGVRIWDPSTLEEMSR